MQPSVTEGDLQAGIQFIYHMREHLVDVGVATLYAIVVYALVLWIKRSLANMDNMKLPIALVVAMGAQLAGGVWWVSQQAATISSLEESVKQFASKMAVEDNVNLKRDVLDNMDYIDGAFSEIEELWEETESLTKTIGAITALQQRLALLENSLKFMNRDHMDMLDPRN